MILNNTKPAKDGILESFKKRIKVHYMEWRYGVTSSSMKSNGLACYIASAHTVDSSGHATKIAGGLVGKDDLSARLAALNLWACVYVGKKC